MSDDWESVTKIGSKVRPGGSAVAKEKVIRSEAQLNAARRQGADIATEKKFGGTNSVSLHLFLQHKLSKSIFGCSTTAPLPLRYSTIKHIS